MLFFVDFTNVQRITQKSRQSKIVCLNQLSLTSEKRVLLKELLVDFARRILPFPPIHFLNENEKKKNI